MVLLERRVLNATEVSGALKQVPKTASCAVVLVARATDVDERPSRWLQERVGLVVLVVDVVRDGVRFELRDMGHDSLLSALRDLAERHGMSHGERVARFQLYPAEGSSRAEAVVTHQPPLERPLLAAASNWIHAVFLGAVSRQRNAVGDLPGFTVAAESLRHLLGGRAPSVAPEVDRVVSDAEAALERALAAADPLTEPLAVLCRNLDLDLLEWKLALLTLAPELDVRYQKCIGFLLDDLGRRAGTLTLFASLLGEPVATRCRIAAAGGLSHWHLLDRPAGGVPAVDEPIRLDPQVAGWLLGQARALERDPHLRRVLRPEPWPGGSLLRRPQERSFAISLVNRLRAAVAPGWMVLAGSDAAGWRALLEVGAEARDAALARLEAARLFGRDRTEIEEVGIRFARLVRLAGRLPVIDATLPDPHQWDEDAFRTLVGAIAATGRWTAVIGTEPERIVRLLGAREAVVLDRAELDAKARESMLRAAAHDLGFALDNASAAVISNLFPLQVDGLEDAVRVARARTGREESQEQLYGRLVAACRSTASQSISKLAQRVPPTFRLDDVVVPADRRSQFVELIDNVRFASKVLDEWKFGEKLPYGRGVTALFHGPSGTGKTMAAQALAGELGVELFALDLSRVVSKYIGDTEKNIDAVFSDAARCGAAVLIDEADALFGKRSEVKDAHDRYANIEVAYLLQRMEGFEGLAILTTNLRQNLDPAFLRRIRFIVDFPRPDAEAREAIWRRCLPADSHALGDDEFRRLARRLDLTGGSIRQITLRAAFIAAASGSAIGLPHIARAAHAELAKLGLPAVDVDVPAPRKAA